MKGIAEDYLGTIRLNLLRRDTFDSSIGADRHKDRRLNLTTAKFQRTAS
jgi:hypothetical protein